MVRKAACSQMRAGERGVETSRCQPRLPALLQVTHPGMWVVMTVYPSDPRTVQRSQYIPPLLEPIAEASSPRDEPYSPRGLYNYFTIG